MSKRKTTDKTPVHTKDVTDLSVEGTETTVEQGTAAEVVEQEETVNEVTEEAVVQEVPVEEESVVEEVTDQDEEEPEAEQPQLEPTETVVTNTTEPAKVTGQTDPFLSSYYKRRIF